jgi:hypothetical protein
VRENKLHFPHKDSKKGMPLIPCFMIIVKSYRDSIPIPAISVSALAKSVKKTLGSRLTADHCDYIEYQRTDTWYTASDIWCILVLNFLLAPLFAKVACFQYKFHCGRILESLHKSSPVRLLLIIVQAV